MSNKPSYEDEMLNKVDRLSIVSAVPTQSCRSRSSDPPRSPAQPVTVAARSRSTERVVPSSSGTTVPPASAKTKNPGKWQVVAPPSSPAVGPAGWLPQNPANRSKTGKK